jgi:transcriptional regulator with XRE-family HTH domain
MRCICLIYFRLCGKGAFMSNELGARLQAVRKNFQLTQRELAKRSGLTNATISLIESNKVSPSVSSLKKVLDGIPMSLADFFTYQADSITDQVFYSCADQPDVGSGDIHFHVIGAGRDKRKMCVLREVLLPGADTGEDMLEHEGEESGVIIQGKIELTVGEESKTLTQGEGYYFDSQTPHRFRNVGEEEAIIISANTPASF